jgi:hypothetical protein
MTSFTLRTENIVNNIDFGNMTYALGSISDEKLM